MGKLVDATDTMLRNLFSGQQFYIKDYGNIIWFEVESDQLNDLGYIEVKVISNHKNLPGYVEGAIKQFHDDRIVTIEREVQVD